jgi:predicted PurR-regulated permease PerM
LAKRARAGIEERMPDRVEIILPRALYVVALIVGLGYALWWLEGVITPIFLAYAIAYALDPVIDRLEAWRVPRPLGILIVFVVSFGIVAAFAAVVIPSIVADVTAVVQELPEKARQLSISFVPWLEGHGIKIPHSTEEWVARLSERADSFASSFVVPAGGVLGSLATGTFSVIGSVFAALIVPVLALYFLNDFDRISAGVLRLVPPRYRETVTSYAREIHTVLGQFIRGQLTVMAILAVLYGGSYALLGVRLAAPIGIVAGMLNFVPYVGGAFALVAGLLMSLLGGFNPSQLLGVVIAYSVVQSLEGFVITPRIVGKNVQISETWVLVALFIGGEIFGFLGVLMAVPAAAVSKIFVVRLLARYEQSSLFLSPASVIPEPPPEEPS